MQQHGRKYFARRPPYLPLPHPDTVGVNRSKFHFFKHGHVAFQVKENHKCSNMVPNILPAHPIPSPPPPPTLGMGSVGQIQLFQDMVMLHIKLKGTTKYSNMIVIIMPADTHLTLGSKFNLFKTWSCGISDLRKSQNIATCYQIFCPQTPHPPDPGDWVNRSKFNFFRT